MISFCQSERERDKCRCLLWWNGMYVKCKWVWIFLFSHSRNIVLFEYKFTGNGNMDTLIIHEIWLLCVTYLHTLAHTLAYRCVFFFGNNKTYINKRVLDKKKRGAFINNEASYLFTYFYRKDPNDNSSPAFFSIPRRCCHVDAYACFVTSIFPLCNRTLLRTDYVCKYL